MSKKSFSLSLLLSFSFVFFKSHAMWRPLALPMQVVASGGDIFGTPNIPEPEEEELREVERLVILPCPVPSVVKKQESLTSERADLRSDLKEDLQADLQEQEHERVRISPQDSFFFRCNGIDVAKDRRHIETLLKNGWSPNEIVEQREVTKRCSGSFWSMKDLADILGVKECPSDLGCGFSPNDSLIPELENDGCMKGFCFAEIFTIGQDNSDERPFCKRRRR